MELASAYCGLSPGAFRQAVRDGLWPAPMNVGRRLLWDRSNLDLAQDRRMNIPSVATEGSASDQPHDPLMDKLNAKDTRRMGQRRP